MRELFALQIHTAKLFKQKIKNIRYRCNKRLKILEQEAWIVDEPETTMSQLSHHPCAIHSNGYLCY